MRAAPITQGLIGIALRAAFATAGTAPNTAWTIRSARAAERVVSHTIRKHLALAPDAICTTTAETVFPMFSSRAAQRMFLFAVNRASYAVCGTLRRSLTHANRELLKHCLRET